MNYRPTKTVLSAAIATALAGTGSVQAQGVIEEIMVTATKRAENMQDIPVAVQAMTGESLRELGVANFDEYVQFLPNVVAAGRAPGQSEIYIRGAATEQSAITVSSVQGSAPAVALYQDEQPVSFGGRNLDIYAVDLARIEVLPGPQGTLFGSSSQSGTVRLITNKPDPSSFQAGFTADVSTTTGGEASTAITAYMNMPFSDKLAVRVAAFADSAGGWIDNDLGTYESDIEVINRNQISGSARICTGVVAVDDPACAGVRADMSQATAENSNLVEKDFNDATYRGARLGLVYDFNDDWSILLQHTGQSLETEGVFEYDPQLGGSSSVNRFVPVENQDSFGLTTWTLSGRLGMLDLIYTGGYLDREVESITDYTSYTSGGGYQVYYMCIGGYSSGDQCFDPTKQYKDQTENSRFTNELRVSMDGERWRGTVGVFLDEGETNSQGQFQYFGAVDAGFRVSSAPGTLDGVPVRGVNDPTGRGPTTIFVNDFTRKEDQIAVFGELTFDFTDTLSASIGARWYDLDFNLGGSTGSSFGCKGTLAEACDGTAFDNRVSHRHESLGAYNESGDPADLLTFFSPGNTAAIIAGVNDGSFNISGLGSDGTANQSDTIVRATLNWSLSDGVMLFGTYSEGFRPQTTNRNAAAQAGNQTGVYQGYMVPAVAKTDELTNYEIGIKSDFMGGSMRLNATAFWSEITELQTTRFDPSNVAFLVFIENVGDAEISGLDADWTWAATDRWTFNAAFSFVSTELTRINPQLVGVSVPEGSDLPFTPDFSGNLRARYDWPLNNWGGDAYVQGSLAYTGERKASIIGNAYFAEDVTREVFDVSGSGLEIAAEGGDFGNLIDPSTGNVFLNGRYVMEAYTLVNLATGFIKDGWGAELYVNNATDESAQIFINTQDYHPRVTTNRPRTTGLRFFYDFE